MGVSEYRFEMEAAAGRESGTEWRIVDVGGSRSQVRSALHLQNNIETQLACFLSVVSDFFNIYTLQVSKNPSNFSDLGTFL